MFVFEGELGQRVGLFVEDKILREGRLVTDVYAEGRIFLIAH
jgi:hypothetical protein